MNTKAYFSLICFKDASGRLCSIHRDLHWQQLYNLAATLYGICHLFGCHWRWWDLGKLCLGSLFLLTHSTILTMWCQVVPPNYIDARKYSETYGIFGKHDCFCYLWVIAFNTQLTKSEASLHRQLEFYFSTGFSLPGDFWESFSLSWRSLATSTAIFSPDAA